MNNRRRSSLVTGAMAFALLFPIAAGADQPPEGFAAIFNGKDLEGWEGSPEYWSARDGALTGTADGTLKYNRFIVWKGGKVRNFELRVKVKVSPGGNSGLQYRGTERPDLGESVVTGYQCDVVPDRPDYDGMLYEERGRRILSHSGEKVVIDPKGQPWVVGEMPLKAHPAGEWHDYRVLVEGNRHRHWIDGQPTVDLVDLDERGRKLEGVLAVQVHVGPPMTIQYRDVFLKQLPDDLPLTSPEQAPIPEGSRKVAPQGQDKPRKPDLEVKVEVDTSEVPELAPWAEKAKALAEEWHPILSRMLASDGFTPPTEVTLTFKKGMRGVAHASGNRISIAANWVKQHPEDLGMVVHELAHVIQSYPPSEAGWLVEGIADYLRFHHYEPQVKLSIADPAKASYRDSYRTTAQFLVWLEAKHEGTVGKLNAALRRGEYKDELFQEIAGKDLDALWAEFVAGLGAKKAA
jgi:hypothetical protein